MSKNKDKNNKVKKDDIVLSAIIITIFLILISTLSISLHISSGEYEPETGYVNTDTDN